MKTGATGTAELDRGKSLRFQEEDIGAESW
jgi:hypothetical protein